MYFFKHSLIPIIYTLFSSMIALGIDLWESAPTWVSTVLAIINLALFVFIVFAMCAKDGGEAVKTRKSNDHIRQRIIETGDDLPINRQAEYSAYKGFVIGIFACIPTLVLMTAHLILCLVGSSDFFGLFNVLLVKCITVFFTIGGIKLTGTLCFYCLLFVPFTSLVAGIGYILGAKKKQATYDGIKQIKKNISGDAE